MSDDLDVQRPVIVAMPEGIDAGNASAVGGTLDAAFAQGALVVVADCTSTTFCDSVGFNTLLLTNEKAHAERAELLFVITHNGPLRRVLELLEMQDALAVYPTVDAAVTAGRSLHRLLVLGPRPALRLGAIDPGAAVARSCRCRLRSA